MLGIPQQSSVQDDGGQHGKNDHRAKETCCWSSLDGRKEAEVSRLHEERNDKDVQHGPASDETDEPEHERLVAEPSSPAEMDGQQNENEAYDFEKGDQDAGDKNDASNEIRSVGKEEEYAVQDGRTGPDTEVIYVHNGENIGRKEENEGGKNKGPGRGKTLGPAQVYRSSTPGAIYLLPRPRDNQTTFLTQS